jgi:hypothetical protein
VNPLKKKVMHVFAAHIDSLLWLSAFTFQFRVELSGTECRPERYLSNMVN